MFRQSSAAPRLLLAITGCLALHSASAQTSLLDQVDTIGTSGVGVPIVQTFTSTAAGVYTIVLTDLGATLTPTPAPLASVELAVTQGATVVGTPLAAPGTLSVALAAQTQYSVRIVVPPGSPGSGPIALTVSDPTGAVLIQPTGLAIALPATAPPQTEAVINGTFTVPAGGGGNYQVTFTDFGAPAPLSNVALILVAQGGSTLYATLAAPGTVTTSLALQAGTTYSLFAAGQGSAGLFAVIVTPATGGAPIFSRTAAVGAVMALGTVPGADVATDLSVHDLGFPAKLSQVGALVTRDGILVASLTASGETAVSAAVPATAGADYQIFGYATAAASTAGFYSVDIADGSGDSLLHVSQGVTDPASGIQAFVYPASVASTGSYTVDFTDFGFPAGLTGGSLALAQNGALVGTAVAPGATLNASLAVDPLDVLVVATPAAGGGLFGFDVLAGSGTALLRESQGVGAAFSATPVTVTAAGNYIVNVTDVGFPAPFSELAVVVTQGGQNIGSIIGGGQFTFSATPGSYILNFIATPNATADAGTFALSVVEAPPAPTVTLSASALEVSSGGTVTLTWMTQNATTCTASGGWSGTLATSGSQTSAKVTASTTYTLSCTGEGGTTTQSVTVALAPSSHGGGELDIETLFALLMALAWARHRINPGQLRAWPRVTRRS